MGERWAPAAVVLGGLAVGALTSLLQTWLPHQAASLANSAGPWCAVAFALARLGRHPWVAAAYGAVALLALDAGYYVTAGARGFPISSASVTFWALAALLVGPPLGIGARWLDARHPLRQVCAVAVLPTVLVVEGVRSLAQVADATYPPYWFGEVAVGLLLAGALAVRARARGRAHRRTA